MSPAKTWSTTQGLDTLLNLNKQAETLQMELRKNSGLLQLNAPLINIGMNSNNGFSGQFFTQAQENQIVGLNENLKNYLNTQKSQIYYNEDLMKIQNFQNTHNPI